MAKRLDKFTAAYRGSRIPFLLSEVITDGHGEMVDLLCRFANDAAAALLDIPAEELTGARFSRWLPPSRLGELAAIQAVAFSGSAASFPCATAAGRSLRVTCYQTQYGLVGCLLDSDSRDAEEPALSGVSALLELSRDGLQCLSFSPQLCALTGWSRKEFLSRFTEDFSALVAEEDWPDLLQDLLDASREGRTVRHPLRLLRREEDPLWAELRADAPVRRDGRSQFRATVLDVDHQQQALSRLADQLRQVETDRDLLADLLDGLPAGCCLFRQTDGDALPTPLRLSHRMAELLNCSPEELSRHLAEDPLWLVPESERPGLAEAALRARESGLPFRHTCRLLTSPPVRLSLMGVWRPWADGSRLLYLLCLNLTAEADQQAFLHRQARLTELLLDRSGNAALDYDPAADTLRFQRYESDGHRTVRMISGYLASPNVLEGVHPEDQKKMAAAVKRAVRAGHGESLEFRGDPDGQGWRWYRLTWAPQPEDGHLLGKTEDISLTRAVKARFRAMTLRQKKLLPGVLASARLDLDADRILDAKGVSRHLVRVLFGNTADACLRHLRDNIPVEAQREAFDGLFRRDALLEAYIQGERHLTLTHTFSPGTGVPVRVETVLELTPDPDTAHATAFLAIRELDTF